MIATEEKKLVASNIGRLLRPRSIAIVGASATPGSLGESVLLNLETAAYAGDLHFVNPKKPVIHGKQSFGSIEELPANIDCAVLAVPGSAVLPSVRSCAEKGVRSLIVFSAGFAEGGTDGEKAQRELADIARQNSMVLLGPNCLGMVNYVDSIPLTFVVTPPQPRSERPGAAIVSQSGALAAVIGVNMRHHRIPLSYAVSTGNEARNGAEDFIEHLIGDPSTRVLSLVIEQFRQPQRFLELAEKARAAGQFMVLLHPGRSKAARASAVTHTGAIAGDYEVMHTIVTHHGVIHVESMEELVDVTQILVHCGKLPAKGAAILTESGAFKGLTLDLCDRVGLELPTFSASTEEKMREALPPFVPPSNPLDLTAQALVDPGLYQRTLAPLVKDDRFGSVLLAIILTDPQTTERKLPAILDAVRTLKPDKPILFAALDEGAPFDSPRIDELRDLGVACFPSAERAIRALAYMTARGSQDSVFDVECDQPLTKLQGGVLAEYQSKEILSRIGIPIPAGRLARDVEEAVRIANEIGFPVVLKAQANDLPHKSEAGGVILGVYSADAVADAWAKLHRNVSAYAPGLTLDGVLVERMGPKGVELILGARKDADWGPVVLVGFGGVLAEAIHDARLMPPSLTAEQIERELNLLRCSALLRGFRGSPALDVAAAARVVSKLGRLMRSNPRIAEVDINPLVVYPAGEGAIALDALFCIAGDEISN